MTSGTIEQASREKRMAALGSVGSAVVLVSLKVFLAAITGSLGILSEALHSSLDLVAAVITYLSVRVADKPADAQHLYGHGKVESFSAFVETALLFLTALYIIWEAFQRLLGSAAHAVRPSLMAILILTLTMGIDFVRSRALNRVAKKYPSEALEADALHFSTDVWSTFVVVLGITGAWLGVKFDMPWLAKLDAVAALGVAGVIIWIGSRLGRKTVDALLDVAPRGLRERIANAVDETEGVLQTERVRVRRAGQRYFVDVTISVPRTASLEQAHAASDAVERRIETIVPADVVVHVEPRARNNEPLFETIRAIAQRRGLAVHELSAHQYEGHLFIELHLEVDDHYAANVTHYHAGAVPVTPLDLLPAGERRNDDYDDNFTVSTKLGLDVTRELRPGPGGALHHHRPAQHRRHFRLHDLHLVPGGRADGGQDQRVLRAPVRSPELVRWRV